MFFLHGLASGSWLSRIPAVQEHLALGEAALGLALLGGGPGTLLAMVPAGALIARHGSRAMVVATSAPACLALCLIALAVNAPTLFAALMLWGASAGSLDVAMNAQGPVIEQRRGRPIMSSLHGLWSIGAMAGGGTSALLAAAGVSVQTRFLLGAPLLLATVALASRAMVRGDQGGGGVSFVRPRGALPALALVTFCAVTAEGSMSDWSGVYLRRVLGARSDGGFRRRGPGRWPSGRRPPHRAHWPSGARARLRGAVLRERPLEATQADAALAAIAVVHLAVGECAPEPPDEVDHTRVVSAGSPGAK